MSLELRASGKIPFTKLWTLNTGTKRQHNPTPSKPHFPLFLFWRTGVADGRVKVKCGQGKIQADLDGAKLPEMHNELEELFEFWIIHTGLR